MKISRLIVRGYQQFEDLDLDLTNPLTKEPLDRVCFLGTNGTGKSTLLQLVARVLSSGPALERGGVVLEIDEPGGRWGAALGRTAGRLDPTQLGDVESMLQALVARSWPNPQASHPTPMERGRDLVVAVSADSSSLLQNDPPHATLDTALQYRLSQEWLVEVGPQRANDFWRLLMSIVARRQETYLAFLERPENSTRTQGELRAEFARTTPDVLPELADLWNRILRPAGIEVDLEAVRLPRQLSDTLSMDVRLARTRERLPYNALSSGLRSFLFRLGYLKTLFFEPPHGSSFVLVDEPEASLHPDFLYDIVDVYQSVCLGSQLFFATHSPIVAAQFKPEERVILEFDENRYVKARRGTAPEGDDPNDVLRSDFHVRSVLGKEGVKKWERFLELDELLRREEDAALREKYRREYMEIGAAYNFEPRVHA